MWILHRLQATKHKIFLGKKLITAYSAHAIGNQDKTWSPYIFCKRFLANVGRMAKRQNKVYGIYVKSFFVVQNFNIALNKVDFIEAISFL